MVVNKLVHEVMNGESWFLEGKSAIMSPHELARVTFAMAQNDLDNHSPE